MVQETKQTITNDHSKGDAKEWIFAHSEALLLAIVETILEICSKASSGVQPPSCSAKGDCLDKHDDYDKEEV